jgi:hypothetical protein
VHDRSIAEVQTAYKRSDCSELGKDGV